MRGLDGFEIFLAHVGGIQMKMFCWFFGFGFGCLALCDSGSAGHRQQGDRGDENVMGVLVVVHGGCQGGSGTLSVVAVGPGGILERVASSSRSSSENSRCQLAVSALCCVEGKHSDVEVMDEWKDEWKDDGGFKMEFRTQFFTEDLFYSSS